MKPILILLFALVLISPSCKKSSKTTSTTTTTSYMSTGTIKGPSMFMTACGAAYWIVIDTVNARTTFDSVPVGSGIDLSTATFPINVKLNWHYVLPNTCSIIIIDAIEKVE